MRTSTEAAGRNANGTAIEFRSIAECDRVQPLPENENARAQEAAGRVAF